MHPCSAPAMPPGRLRAAFVSKEEFRVAPALLRVGEAAERLNVCRGTIYRLARDEEIRVVRLGHGPSARLRIPAEELERFVAEGPLRRPAAAM